MTFRICEWCEEKYHEDDDWVDIGNDLIVCYPCSLRDVADEWAAGDDHTVDPAEEAEWNDNTGEQNE